MLTWKDLYFYKHAISQVNFSSHLNQTRITFSIGVLQVSLANKHLEETIVLFCFSFLANKIDIGDGGMCLKAVLTSMKLRHESTC